MGNNCCGQPAETTNNFNLTDKKGEQINKDQAASAPPINHKPEVLNERELEYKTDHALGEGATYTG